MININLPRFSKISFSYYNMQIKELQILYRGIIIIKANRNDTTRRMTDMKILVFEMRDDEAQAVRRQAEKDDRRM